VPWCPGPRAGYRDRVSKREIAKSWASRTLLTARAGLSAAKVAGRAVVDHARSAADLDGDDAEALVSRLDDLKGLSMKVGQMASLSDNLPPRVQAALARLQSAGTGLDAETVHATLRHAYGRDHREVFETFDDTPFAAASIGQVHHATVGGQRVAVKVQYPGIEEGIRHDLRNIASLRFLLAASSFSTKELLEELRERLAEECDYRQEAGFQEHFRAALADRPAVVVPRVLPDLVRSTVLVTELVEAERFAVFRDRAGDAERGRAGEVLFGTAMWAIFGMGMFNGDPHPGNYLFLPSGQVAFLDYGCVRVFDPEFTDAWKAFALSLLDDDRAAFPDAAVRLGIVGSSRYDFDAGWRVFQTVYRPMKSKTFRFDSAFSKESFDALAWKNPNLWRSNIPPHLAFSWRLNWGLFSVLSDLRAEGDFRTPFREAVESPTPNPPKPAPIGAPAP
jgi:predicted unusual protein kinase regulating ubiquinone biosynthesis (AarF/ABC1/UbiB family)